MQIGEVQSFLERKYSSLSDVITRAEQGPIWLEGEPCPVLLWQNWQLLGESAPRMRTVHDRTRKLRRPNMQWEPESMGDVRVVYVRKSKDSRIPDPTRVTIGRNPGNDIRLEISDLSRNHAVLIFDNNTSYVMDIGSSNGTMVNDRPIRPHDRTGIQSTDYLSFGSAAARFQYFSREDFETMIRDGLPYVG